MGKVLTVEQRFEAVGLVRKLHKLLTDNGDEDEFSELYSAVDDFIAVERRQYSKQDWAALG